MPKKRVPKVEPPGGPDETAVEAGREFENLEVELARRTLEEFDYVGWERALQHRRQMGKFFSDSFDPGLALILERGGDAPVVFLADDPDAASAEVRPWENPNERASFGFVDSFAQLKSDSDFIPGTLVLRFDLRALGSVVRDTLRLFQWNPESGTFRKLAFSGVVRDGDYVWGRVTMPGEYALVGLNADPFIVRTLKAICGSRDVLQLLDPPQRPAYLDKICGLILCAPEFQDLAGNPAALDSLVQEQVSEGWPPPPPGWQPPIGGYGDICAQCTGLDISVAQPPECELIPQLQSGIVFDAFPGCTDPGWQSLGPANLGGCMFDLAVDPNDNHRVYAASANGGLWRLDWSFGFLQYQWTPLMDQADSLTVTAVAVAPSASQTLYIADGSQRVLQSNNFGANWVASSQSFGAVRKLIVDPQDANRVLIVSSTGVWVMAGGLVQQIHPGDITDAAMDPGDPSILYVGVRNTGLRKSMDAGQTWTTVLSLAQASALSVGAFGGLWIGVALGQQGTDANRTVAVKFGPRSVNAAGQNCPQPPFRCATSEVFVSRDGGQNWARTTTPPPLGDYNQGDWVNVIAVDPTNNNVMLVGGEELYRTADGGATWVKVMAYRYLSPNGHEDQHAIAFDTAWPAYTYLANDGGVYYSIDRGATWFDLNKGLTTVQFYHMGIAADKAVGNAYHWGVLASQTVANRQWEQIDGGAWEFVPARGDPKRPSFFYYLAGTLVRRRYPSTGAGDFLGNFGNFTPSFGLAVDTRAGSNTILASDATPPTGQPPGTPTLCRIRRALDGDQAAPNWTIEPGVNLNNDPIVSIQFARSSPGMAYAASASGLIFVKTPDANGPGPWVQRGQWQPGVRAMAVNPNNSNRLYIINAWEVGRSLDGGVTWQAIMGTGNNSLPISQLFSIIASPDSGQTIFLAAEIGIFFSPDEGVNWYALDQGLPNAPVREILWSGNYLYASLHGRGLWRRKPCL